MEAGMDDTSGVSLWKEPVVPASLSLSADVQQQEGMTGLLRCFQCCWHTTSPRGGNASSPRRGDVGGVWRSSGVPLEMEKGG